MHVELVWCEKRKRFHGKKPHLTKVADTVLGHFALIAIALPTHTGYAGSSFEAANGKGALTVKALDDPPPYCRLVRCTMGGCNLYVNWDFAHDGHLCRMAHVWSFGGVAVQQLTFIFELNYEFCNIVRQEVYRGACACLLTQSSYLRSTYALPQEEFVLTCDGIPTTLARISEVEPDGVAPLTAENLAKHDQGLQRSS